MQAVEISNQPIEILTENTQSIPTQFPVKEEVKTRLTGQKSKVLMAQKTCHRKIGSRSEILQPLRRYFIPAATPEQPNDHRQHKHGKQYCKTHRDG
jgi:hypothetical protein